ncbi:MAG: DUF2846 domain-containing protein [Gammaproteobacteria bacterium]|nr:DUF2846 domain-containing protein [Gammaproteobacteria bacterium]
MKLKSFLFISVISLLLSACSATGPKFSPVQIQSQDKSLLYVYRNDLFCLGGRSPDIHVDNKKIDALSNNGYISVDISPGPHFIEAKGLFDLPSTSIKIEAEPMKSYYVKWIPECNFLSWHLKLIEMPEGSALDDIKNSRAIKSN